MAAPDSDPPAFHADSSTFGRGGDKLPRPSYVWRMLLPPPIAHTVRAALIGLAIAHSIAGGAVFAEEPPLWTQVPTRVDRSRQHFERLPAAKVERDSRSWLVIPPRFRVLDSTSFMLGEQRYRLAGLRPISSKRYCKAPEGGRWACGRMASIFLGNLLRGHRLLCDIEPGPTEARLSHCAVGTRDLAEAIIRNGYGMAEGDDRLRAIQSDAIRAADKGLWRNPGCVTDFDHC